MKTFRFSIFFVATRNYLHYRDLALRQTQNFSEENGQSIKIQVLKFRAGG